MNSLSHAWAVMVPLVEDVPDPADVRPGLLGFGAFVFLILAVVFLSFSFRKQLKKVNFEEVDDGGAGSGRAPGRSAGATAITGEPTGGSQEPGRHRAPGDEPGHEPGHEPGDEPGDEGRPGKPRSS